MDSRAVDGVRGTLRPLQLPTVPKLLSRMPAPAMLAWDPAPSHSLCPVPQGRLESLEKILAQWFQM